MTDQSAGSDALRVLIDIVHPAHALFFFRPIQQLRGQGARVLILSRHKDVTCTLLDDLGLHHKAVSSAGSGRLGLARELLARDLAVTREAIRFRPHVMTGYGGVAVAHAGAVLGIPSVAFYDTEVATLQNRLTWPFLHRLHVPECYTGPVPKGRTVRFRGVKELSYFHPEQFVPDRARALAAGLDPERNNFLVRAVGWGANHDFGKGGWDDAELRGLVTWLNERGRVHLSSERPLPADLHPFLWQGAPLDLHHLAGFCRLYVGESATMAVEAALMGVPAVYAGQDPRGYLDELEAEGLMHQWRGGDGGVTTLLEGLLSEPAEEWRGRRDRYLATCPDLPRYIVEALWRDART